jgi:CheY-like chemotaxis protein
MDNRDLEVLLIEDSAGDIDLTREALKEGKISIHLNVVEDGFKALKYLRREQPYPNSVRPDLILLDLNLPKVDGREVLREIKSDPQLRLIPVVVLTTSEAEVDILKTYGLGANCFITKPVGFPEFIKVVKSIEEFWFTIVKLPSKDAA